jgi:hypothetical protein
MDDGSDDSSDEGRLGVGALASSPSVAPPASGILILRGRVVSTLYFSPTGWWR